MAGLFNVIGEYTGGDLVLKNAATGATILTIAAAGTITIGTAPDDTLSNVTEDRTLNADSTDTAELADVLGTLIRDLQTIGLLQ